MCSIRLPYPDAMGMNARSLPLALHEQQVIAVVVSRLWHRCDDTLASGVQ